MAQARRDGMFVNCKIDTEVVKKLELYMKKSRLSKTAIVGMALEDYLKKVMPDCDEQDSESE